MHRAHLTVYRVDLAPISIIAYIHEYDPLDRAKKSR
jgi:hypothetical protein